MKERFRLISTSPRETTPASFSPPKMFILVWFFPIYPLQYSNQNPQTKIADLVQIAPKDLGQKSRKVIEDNINAKYANKVIQKIGLCICLYDLTYASDGLIGNQTGFVNVIGIFPLLRDIWARASRH